MRKSRRRLGWLERPPRITAVSVALGETRARRRPSLVLEDGAGIRAFVVGFYSSDNEDEAYIHFVGVDPKLRGQGLARQLYAIFFSLHHNRTGMSPHPPTADYATQPTVTPNGSAGFPRGPSTATEFQTAVRPGREGGATPGRR